MAISDNIWWTAKARMQSEQRLNSNNFHSQVLLFWYSFFAVCVSIYYLRHEPSKDANIAWVVFSVLLLCMSGLINGFSFKERAALIKECYEQLKILYQKAKKMELESSGLDAITTEYTNILSICENHTNQDFYFAVSEEYLLNGPHSRNQLTKQPTCYMWVRVFLFKACRICTLALFYGLPVILLALVSR